MKPLESITYTVPDTGKIVTHNMKCTTTYEMPRLGRKGTSIHRRDRQRPQSEFLEDREAQIDFQRWAAVLGEYLVMEIYNVNSPLCGTLVGLNDTPNPDEVTCEVKTVAQWGRELAKLDSENDRAHSFNQVRLRWILRMLHDAGLIWRNGPEWWYLV